MPIADKLLVQRQRHLVYAVDAEEKPEAAQEKEEGGRGRPQHRRTFEVPRRPEVAREVASVPECDVRVVADPRRSRR